MENRGGDQGGSLTGNHGGTSDTGMVTVPIMIIGRLLLLSPWFGSIHQVYSGVGADIVMESSHKEFLAKQECEFKGLSSLPNDGGGPC